jgi:hypothetical protein
MTMRLISLLLISSVIVVCSCDTEGNVDPVYQTHFLKYYGEDGNQEGVDLLINADGSMILLGNSSSQTNPVTIQFISKVDPFGTVQWQRQLGGLNEKAVDVELDNNGNLIVLSNFAEGVNSRVKLYRISQNGVGMDSTMIDFQEWQMGKSITVATDGTILVAGSRKPYPPGNLGDFDLTVEDLADMTILAVDASFQNDSIVAGFGGGELNGAALKVFESPTGGYNLLGYSDRPAKDDIRKTRFEAFTLNDFFSSPGQRVIVEVPGETQVAASAIETFSIPGYIMVGTSYVSPLSSNIYLVSYYNPLDRIISVDDRRPTTQYHNQYLLNRRLESVSVAAAEPDNLYVLANEITDNNQRDIFLLRLTINGSVLGSVSFGSLEGDDSAGAVRAHPDGRIAVFGTMEVETQKKMVLIMLSPNGNFSN